MEQSKTLERQKSVDVNRGIYVIRYAAARDDINPPKVKVSLAPGSDRNVDLLLHPDCTESILWQPGTGLVVRALNPGKLFVEVIPIHANGSTAATVKIETLSQGTDAYQSIEAADAFASALDLRGFRVLGHVAGRGDVIVNADEWIGGPTAPSRIEGIALEWPRKPHDLHIRYAVKFGRPNLAPTPLMNVGAFAGSRGRALPLVGVVLELSGPGASRYRFVTEAVFLGSPTRRVAGERVVLSGPTGREPLVGLRITLEETVTAAREAPRLRARKSQAAGRVRVFRSAAKQSRSRSGK